jgi:hypothetical protein
MQTRAAAIGLAIMLAGCASPGRHVIPPGPWRYVETVAGCVGFNSYRGRPYDRTVLLDETFEQSLMAKVQAVKAPMPRCWYETPAHTLLLRAGDFCGNPRWITFERTGDIWVVTKVEDPIMSCHRRSRA